MPETSAENQILNQQRAKKTLIQKFSSKKGAIILFYFAFFIFVGIPIWHFSTGVLQTHLPHDRIISLASKINSSLEYVQSKLTKCDSVVQTVIVTGASDNGKLKAVTDSLKELTEPSVGEPVVVKVDPTENLQSLESVVHKIRTSSGSLSTTVGGNKSVLVYLDINTLSLDKLFQCGGANVNHDDVIPYLSINDSGVTYYFFRQSNNLLAKMVQLRQQANLDISQSYKISFTLINSDPENSQLYNWNIEQFVRDRLTSYLQPLGLDIDVQSQLLHYANLPSQPVYNANQNRYEIDAESIQFLLNENSQLWKLDSPLSNGILVEQTLHFVFLIPPAAYVPLTILPYKDDDADVSADKRQDVTNTFLIPKWGSVFLWNPPPTPTESALPPSEDAAVEATTSSPSLPMLNLFEYEASIASQVNQLFDIPFHFCPSRSTPQADGDNVTPVSSLPGLQVDYYKKLRRISSLKRSVHSLLSLSKVVSNMPNVRVDEAIAQHATMSLDAISTMLQQVTSANQSTITLVDLDNLSKTALLNAETAFFHPSMLSMLYFPDSQKLSVYLSLLAPVVMIMFVQLLRILKK